MRVPVREEERECGSLWAEQRGLYTFFRAEVRTEQVCRLYAVFEGGETALGVPAPEGGGLGLRVSIPTSRLPRGKLVGGRLQPKDDPWQSYPGGMEGAVRLPRGYRQGNRFRFPWRAGEQLPCDELMCFYRYVEEEGKSYLEVALDESGCPGV